MQIKDYRNLLIAVTLIGILLFASPVIALFIKPPVGEQFSVIYMLGKNHTFDNVPFNVQAGIQYSLYLGVVNQMGSSQYYTCSVKLGDENSSLPDTTLETPSSLPALYEYKALVLGGATWETPLTFQITNASFTNNVCELYGIALNEIQYSIDIPLFWDSTHSGYYYNLLVELSTYNSTTESIYYANRYVLLALNMTQ